MTTYNHVLNNLEKLKLEKIRAYLPNYLDDIKGSEVSLLDSLLELTSKEIEFKDYRASIANVKVAGFPFEKTLDSFDFTFQPSINKNLIMDLATLRFIDNAENILLLGSSGVGKTHLAIALGVKAAQSRYSTYFVSCHDMMNKLTKAKLENRLDAQLRHYLKYKLLIIDEIGYLPFDKDGANLFFQLIAKRYEKKSTIITTNKVFSKWGEVFGDSTLANAMLDRLIHHSHIIKITGPSYRVKDKIESITPTKDGKNVHL